MMKLLLNLILVVVGVSQAVNLFACNQAISVYALSSSSTGSAPSTENLFKQKCTKCHGADGSGDTSMGRIFNAPDFTDGGWWANHSNSAELVNVITKGKKSMPAFEKKLTKAQIAGLANYVQRFKH